MNYIENIQTYKAAGNSLLRAANKKNEKRNIPDPTVDNHDAFTFPIFFVLFLYFSPSINHAGPIIVFASSICFLAACIFPLFLDTLPTIQHHLPVNSSLTHFRISIFHFTCIFQMFLVLVALYNYPVVWLNNSCCGSNILFRNFTFCLTYTSNRVSIKSKLCVRAYTKHKRC